MACAAGPGRSPVRHLPEGLVRSRRWRGRDGIGAATSLAHHEMLLVQRSWPIERYRDGVRAAVQIPVGWLRHR